MTIPFRLQGKFCAVDCNDARAYVAHLVVSFEAFGAESKELDRNFKRRRATLLLVSIPFSMFTPAVVTV